VAVCGVCSKCSVSSAAATADASNLHLAFCISPGPNNCWLQLEQNRYAFFYLRASDFCTLVRCGVAQLHAGSETHNLDVL
jgi:hypothetical protein